MLKIGYLNPASTPTRTEFNYIWMLFKCFYEDHGKYPEMVEWQEPIYKWNSVTLDDIVENLKNCDVVFFTNYVWNYKINKQVVEQLDPRVITVVGGPHQDDEIIKDYDYIAEPLSPGEVFVLYFIDQLIERNINTDTMLYHKNKNVKIPYNFGTTNVYKRCDSYFREMYNYFNSNIDLYEKIIVVYETTRGCPFQCVYCEWGGGTATKVLKKPIDVVKDEMEYLGSFGNVFLDFCDANTGMFKERDREIMTLMRQNGIHIGDSLSILKTLKLEQKQEMLDWMIENDITRRVISISLQSISKLARDIAKRKDLDLEDILKLIEHITTKWNYFKGKEFYIDLELILAMPGSTVHDFYEEFKLYYKLGYWDDTRYPYMILPATEANDPEYQKKYQIKTSQVLSHLDTNYSGKWDDIKINPLYDTLHYEYDTMVECFSYSFDDYIEMFIMNAITPSIGRTWIKEYVTYDNVSQVAKELWNILNGNPLFLLYKELIIDIFKDQQPRSIDKFENGPLKDKRIKHELRKLINDYEKEIREGLDEFCNNL